ncbi:MAG: carboxymuconolactone decarboxylase family protein [Rhodospirillales bacterium]|nr:carboxymuconolactone decarboxylase family protein [Rhodospirillales bacterium]
MQRIPSIDPAQAPIDVKATLDDVKAKLGGVPNIFRTMAVAPSVLNGYLAFSGAAAQGKLPAALREQIALVAAGANACDYCASAHQALGKMAGLGADDIVRALKADAADPKTKAALSFARKLVIDRGVVSDTDLSAVKAVGFGDGEILEIVANVALNIFTNYFNHVAGTEVDFPKVDAKRAAA